MPAPRSQRGALEHSKDRRLNQVTLKIIAPSWPGPSRSILVFLQGSSEWLGRSGYVGRGGIGLERSQVLEQDVYFVLGIPYVFQGWGGRDMRNSVPYLLDNDHMAGEKVQSWED